MPTFSELPTFFRQMTDSMHAGRAFGPAYESGGCTVVPVAFVVAGGGAGGSQIGEGGEPVEVPAPRLPVAGLSPRAGIGGGFGYVCWPVGAYVMEDGKARWVPAIDVGTAMVLGAFVFRTVVRALRRR